MKVSYIRKMIVSVLLVATALMSSQALAHKLSVFAYAEGDQVYVEGYFADGKKAQNSKVEVFNPAGQLLNEGITGDEGEYRFTVAKPEDLRIVLNAGMGHRGEYLLPANELGDGAGMEGIAPTQQQSSAPTNLQDGGHANVEVTNSGKSSTSAVICRAFSILRRNRM